MLRVQICKLQMWTILRAFAKRKPGLLAGGAYCRTHVSYAATVGPPMEPKLLVSASVDLALLTIASMEGPTSCFLSRASGTFWH